MSLTADHTTTHSLTKRSVAMRVASLTKRALALTVATVLAMLVLTSALPPLVADQSDRAIVNAGHAHYVPHRRRCEVADPARRGASGGERPDRRDREFACRPLNPRRPRRGAFRHVGEDLCDPGED